MGDFRVLFKSIDLEHLKLQLIVYSYMVLVPTIALSASGEPLVVSMFLSMLLATSFKFLSIINSAFKACIIIWRCKKGSFRFKCIFREWTGRNFT